MDRSSLYPFQDEPGRLERHCKLPVHIGKGTMRMRTDSSHPLGQMIQQFQRISGTRPLSASEIDFDATFLVPATGSTLILLRNESGVRVPNLFGEELTIIGDSSDGSFKLTCPQFYVEANSSENEESVWAFASPINCVATITYGEPRPIARVIAVINNFDFDYGNWPIDEKQPTWEKILRVQA
jgi:hypothetical protein